MRVKIAVHLNIKSFSLHLWEFRSQLSVTSKVSLSFYESSKQLSLSSLSLSGSCSHSFSLSFSCALFHLHSCSFAWLIESVFAMCAHLERSSKRVSMSNLRRVACRLTLLVLSVDRQSSTWSYFPSSRTRWSTEWTVFVASLTRYRSFLRGTCFVVCIALLWHLLLLLDACWCGTEWLTTERV